MTPLRRRMTEDLILRNRSPKTIRTYIGWVADFARYFHTSPDHLGPEHVRSYLFHLVQERQASWNVYKQARLALQFFYRVTLGRDWVVAKVARPKAPVGLPDPEWGERIGAAVVLAPGEALTLEELRRWAGDRLAPYKLPTRLLTLEGLPRNAMGKVTKPDVVRLFTDLHLRRHRQDRGRLQGRSDRARDAPGGSKPAKAPPGSEGPDEGEA